MLQDCVCENIFNAVSKKVLTLQFLDICSSAISFNNLISIVANNTTITHLNISNCDVQGEPDVTDYNLLGVFLEHLDLGSNRITTAFADFISKLISVNYKLKHLDIANCIVQEDELIKITNSLSLLTTLKYLNYSNIVLSTQVANILSKVIVTNVHLDHLDLSSCYLTEPTFSSIASALKQVHALKYFKINSNRAPSDRISSSLFGNSSRKLATFSEGTCEDVPLYEVIPKSYKRPDANVYAPLYMTPKSTPKNRACDCSSCSNGGVISPDKISNHESIPSLSSTETATYASIPVAECKSRTKTTDKMSFSSHSNTDEKATILAENGQGTPLYATVQKSNKKFNVDAITRQTTCSCSSSGYEDVISTDKSSFSHHHEVLTESDNDAVYGVPKQVTPQCSSSTFLAPLASHDMSSHINCYEITGADNHNRMSFVGDEVIPPCSPDNGETLPSDYPSNVDEDDYDTRSIPASETTLPHSNNYSSYNDSSSLVEYDPTDMNEDDYDCMSIAAGEITLQDSDNIPINVLTIIVDILAVDDISVKSHRNLESSLTDHGYESVPIDDLTSTYLSKQSKNLSKGACEKPFSVTDAVTKLDSYYRSTFKCGHDTMIMGASETTQPVDKMSVHAITNVDNVPAAGNINPEYYNNPEIPLLDYQSGYTSVPPDDFPPSYIDRKSDNQLTDNYVSVPPDNSTSSYVHRKSKNQLTDGYVSVPPDDLTSSYVNKKSENHLTDGYVSVPPDDSTSSYVNRRSENQLTDGYVSVPPDDSTSSYSNRKSENHLTDGYESVPPDDFTPSYVNRKLENQLTDGYVSVPNDDFTSSFVSKRTKNLTDLYDDVLPATHIIHKHNRSASKDVDNMLVANRETVLQHSDKMAYASIHANDKITRSHRSSVNSATNYGYETDDFTSCRVGRNSESQLAGNYGDVLSASDRVRKCNSCSGNSSADTYKPIPETYQKNQNSMKYQKESVHYASVSIKTVLVRSKHEKSRSISKEFKETVAGEVHSPINDYKNTASKGTENISACQYEIPLNRSKRTAEHSSITISKGRMLPSDYDDTLSKANRPISGLEDNSKYKASGDTPKEIVVSEVNSLDVYLHYTNIASFISIVKGTATCEYDRLMKVDKVTTEYNSKALTKNTSGNDCVDNASITDNAISGLENSSVDNHCYEDISVTNASFAFIKLTEVITCSCFLECLEISDCRLSDLQVAAVATGLSKLSTLRHLNLSYNQIITDSTALKISSVITINLSLKSINLSNCYLQESGIKIIAEALASLTSLRSIDLSKNKITYNCMQIVAAAITGNFLLEHLNLGHCFEYDGTTTSTRGVNNILSMLTRLTSLKHLDLHSTYINDDTSKLLPVVISNNNKSLCYLDLTDCELRSTVFIAIVKKLQTTFTLKYLILSSNIITNEAARETALVVSHLSLQHLALSDCKMEEGGLMDIAESLLYVSSLKHLDLSYSRITDKVAVTLASSIATNTSLVSLSLNYCLWQSNASYQRICTVVSKMSRLKEFEF